MNSLPTYQRIPINEGNIALQTQLAALRVLLATITGERDMALRRLAEMSRTRGTST